MTDNTIINKSTNTLIIPIPPKSVPKPKINICPICSKYFICKPMALKCCGYCICTNCIIKYNLINSKRCLICGYKTIKNRNLLIKIYN